MNDSRGTGLRLWLVVMAMCAPRAADAVAQDVAVLTNSQSFSGRMISETADHVEIETLASSVPMVLTFGAEEIASAVRDSEGQREQSSAEKTQDTVILNSGHIYTGRIVSETAEYVEMETTISNIPATVKIERARIASLVRGHETWKEQADQKSDSPNPSDEIDQRTRVMEVVLSGTFGEDILPIGFEAAMRFAARNKIEHVVLRINSGGGFVWAAQDIARQMHEQRGKITFHALIERAISASIWPTFACETIHMVPGSTFGGAVIYQYAAGGNAEVDAKFNSIMAAELVAAAAPLGHSPHVVRAMILMDAELYVDARGDKPVLSGSSLDDGTGEVGDFIHVDSASSVLTLTANDADDYGIARAAPSRSIEDLGRLMGIEWDVQTGGRAVMDQWKTQCAQRQSVALRSQKTLLEFVKDAEAAEDIDEALAALTGFEREYPRFANALREYLECFPHATEAIEPKEVRETRESLREVISDLRRAKRERP